MIDKPILTYEDVARIWTEEARKKDPDRTVPVTTVRSYKQKSGKGGYYEHFPVPAPHAEVGGSPYWLPTDEQKLRDWWNNRPGLGRGGRPSTRRPMVYDHGVSPTQLKVGEQVLLIGDMGIKTSTNRDLARSVSVEVVRVHVGANGVEVTGYQLTNTGERTQNNTLRSFLLPDDPETYARMS